jgi:hypothetical protein
MVCVIWLTVYVCTNWYHAFYRKPKQMYIDSCSLKFPWIIRYLGPTFEFISYATEYVDTTCAVNIIQHDLFDKLCKSLFRLGPIHFNAQLYIQRLRYTFYQMLTRSGPWGARACLAKWSELRFTSVVCARRGSRPTSFITGRLSMRNTICL